MTTATSVLVIGAVVVVGLGASVAAFPAGDVTFPTRLASIFGLGVAVWIFVGSGLVLLEVFNAVGVALAASVVTAALYVVGLRRSSPREHFSALREELSQSPAFVFVGLGVLVFVAVSWLVAPEFPMRGGWRYWSDGLELADRGGIPEFTAQWGAAHPVAISKLGGNSLLGELSFVFRDAPFAGMGVALWLSVVGYASGLFALGRELGLRWTAPVLPLLGIASVSLPGDFVLNAGRTSSKLEFYEHEDLGRMLAVVAAAIAVSVARGNSSLGRILAGGVVLAAAALTHLIPAIVFAALIGGVMLARIASGPRRAHAARVGAGVFAVAVVLTATPLAAAQGTVGFQGAGSPQSYTLLEGRWDPTAAVKGLRIPPRLKSERRWYKPPATTIRLATEAAVGRHLRMASVAALGILGVICAVIVIGFGSLELRTLVGGAALMAVTILGVALAFSYRYELYVQATVGERRLFEYASIPLILVVLALAELGLTRLEASSTRAAAALGVSAVLAAALSIGIVGTTGRNMKRTDPFLAAAATTPCDSRLLVGRQRTRGSFQALTGRISITEGLEPFLRPSIVNSVVSVRGAARRFLQEPNESSNVLRQYEVDYVLAPESASLDQARELAFVRNVNGVGVYKVQQDDVARTLPRPANSPGYHCSGRVPLSR
jgi:hypothetical protein